MKPRYILAALLLWGNWAPAQVFVSSHPGQVVPDADTAGYASTVVASGMADPLGPIQVSLTLSGTGWDGGFNGDLYAYLRHGTTSAVLLNRPGRTAANPSGYGDDGLSVTFAESASADLHRYRMTLNGDDDVGLVGPLTGLWKPDGRAVDPITTSDYEGVPRTATLDDFVGLDGNGEWTLHVFDLAAGGEVRLASWSVEMAPVPEAEEFALLMATGLVGVAARRLERVRRGRGGQSVKSLDGV